MFCYPERIPTQMAKDCSELRGQGFFYGLGRGEFVAGAAEFVAALNAIHPFREGNGRTQMVFMALVADQAGYPFDLDRLDVEEFLPAMVASFHGDGEPLRRELAVLTS
jgi:cell filamentation protein